MIRTIVSSQPLTMSRSPNRRTYLAQPPPLKGGTEAREGPEERTQTTGRRNSAAGGYDFDDAWDAVSQDALDACGHRGL